jgi:ribA/ribD-fused uncharacterized protein
MLKTHVNVEWETNIPEYAIHDDKRVCGFFGPFRFLSNFFPARVHYEGLDFPSVEHAYQAAKYPPNQRAQFTSCTAGRAKKLGKQAPDLDVVKWDKKKFDLMALLVVQKFSMNADLGEMLLATEDAYLEETNSWGDVYWGKNEDGEGLNKLGIILMEIRKTLKELNK